ncbi:MAG: 2-oxoglutarate dehydrogenase complex dihydrolipoyllysine-residue succinyltransferase [Fimbriimonadaceae bacterium]|nr:2-oxoglutarate dehydrogenase complex dihydrolipoyllysine-residue succinyltransferase [Fimbriimonadaceae bacterium]
MAVELMVPEVGESISEVVISKWLVEPGSFVAKDAPVVEIETDKVTFELPAPADGFLATILKPNGSAAAVGEVIGSLQEADTAADPAPPTPPETPATVMPAARRALAAHGLAAEEVPASGPGGRLLKEDVERHAAAPPAPPVPPVPATPATPATPPTPPAAAPAAGGPRDTETVPLTPMRRRIAERLVQAQQTAAMLTTFNEIDMSAAMALRKEQQEAFQQRYGIKLGFMSFFVKAAVDALKRFPELNAELQGNDIVYHHYYDIGIAVSGKKGLAVPVLRNAERLSFSEVELKIADFGARARDNKLELDELVGGTFTITNGGVFGSLLSTPILNPPQSGILGMHGINDRPVAVNGQVVIRPMMYIALTYDHRIVDGREAVTFLRRVKECVENPVRMLVEV